MHVHNLISTLHRIKDKTGLYIITESSKYDWLEYASGDTIHEDFFVTPNKKVINPTINSYFENQWFKNWENIKGHSQTKLWFSMPDPYLSSKLLNMFREHMGKCIQFFTGHGWWKKYLKLTKLSNSETCRLCQVPESVESPINIFSECEAMTATRQGLFNAPFHHNN